MSLKESIENAMATKKKSPLQLQATTRKFTLKDKSGYKFHVITSMDPEDGWSAEIKMFSTGVKTEEAALDRLLETGKHFIRMMEESQ